MSRRNQAFLALLLVVPMASVGEGAALWLWPGTILGVGLYGLAKVWVTLLPVVWIRYVEHGLLSLSPARRGGFGIAVLLGVLMAVVIAGVYGVVLSQGEIDPALARQMAARNYLTHWWIYVPFAAVMSTLNALMEEYVWRWFVFRQCERVLGGGRSRSQGTLAAVLAALFFTGHHLAAMRVYFHWDMALLASAGVLVGSLVWSELYIRYRSVWPGFVCHVLADLAIFAVGWHLIFVA